MGGKLVLDNAAIASAFFEDAVLIGIQCPAEPHTFTWRVNRHTGVAFAYLMQAEIRMVAKGRHYAYPVYEYREPRIDLHHLLYVNTHDGRHLLPELKHIDYLWLLRGGGKQNAFAASLLPVLRQLDQVQLVMELTNEKIKHKEHLIF